MTFAEKARLAQRYLAIFNNHAIVLLTIGALLAVIALIALFTTASHWDNEIVPIIIVITFFMGIGACATGFLVDTESSGIPSNQVTQNIDIDELLVKYHKNLPILRCKDKQDYQQLRKVKGSCAYAVSKRYTETHHKLLHEKHFMKHRNARSPWINAKFPEIHVSIRG